MSIGLRHVSTNSSPGKSSIESRVSSMSSSLRVKLIALIRLIWNERRLRSKKRGAPSENKERVRITMWGL